MAGPRYGGPKNPARWNASGKEEGSMPDSYLYCTREFERKDYTQIGTITVVVAQLKDADFAVFLSIFLSGKAIFLYEYS